MWNLLIKQSREVKSQQAGKSQQQLLCFPRLELLEEINFSPEVVLLHLTATIQLSVKHIKMLNDF